MKADLLDFLCDTCRPHARSLTAGGTLTCPHEGATLALDRQGQRTLTFEAGRAPRFTTDRRDWGFP